MSNIDYKKLVTLLTAFLVVEVLSFLSFSFPAFSPFIFGALTLGVLFLSFYRLEYGLLLVVAELVVGSLGHLFYFSALGFPLSIRLVLWTSVMASFTAKFIFQLFREKGRSVYWQAIKSWPLLKYFWLLFLFMVIALANGLLRGHGPVIIFSDFNAWLYFFLLFPILAVYRQPDKPSFVRLRLVFIASAICLSLETLFLLFAFTHNLSFTPEIYSWLRRTIVGEVTPTLSGWPRIFIQSQIYSAVAFFLVFWQDREKASRKLSSGERVLALLVAAFFLSSILISFSRSFWVGLAVALFFTLLLVLRSSGFWRTLRAAVWLLAAGALGFLIIYVTAVFPYPAPGAFSADFMSRLKSQNDAAVASRWSLLPVLVQEIKKEPLLGQGFGATVTYLSRDPRVLAQNPSGLYTTAAFEWGYLDVWLKLGLLGLFAYLFLLGKIVVSALPKRGTPPDYLRPALAVGLVFLAVTHIFTPYLNHPLGIGFLLFGSCLILADRVY